MRLALFPGATREHYEALGAALPEHEPPEHRLVFAAGPVEAGWQVVQVWRSKADLDVFNEAVLLPALSQVGFPRPPVVTDFETAELLLS